jgi:hypothetical protein
VVPGLRIPTPSRVSQSQDHSRNYKSSRRAPEERSACSSSTPPAVSPVNPLREYAEESGLPAKSVAGPASVAESKPEPGGRRFIPWYELLRRTFGEEVTTGTGNGACDMPESPAYA